MGACPDWYAYRRAALQAHCPPWVLTGEQPPNLIYWRNRLLVAEAQEAKADAERTRRALERS